MVKKSCETLLKIYLNLHLNKSTWSKYEDIEWHKKCETSIALLKRGNLIFQYNFISWMKNHAESYLDFF